MPSFTFKGVKPPIKVLIFPVRCKPLRVEIYALPAGIGPCRPAERLRCKGCRARVSVCPRALQAAPGGDLRAAGAELAPAGLQSGFGMRATGPGVQASLGAFLHFNGRYRSSLGRAAVCLECFEAITRQVGGPVIEAWAGKLSELICVLSAPNPAESLLLEAKDV